MGFLRRSSARTRKRQIADGQTLYHLGFANVVTREAPPGFAIHVEFVLSLMSRRVDLVLVRRGKRRRDQKAGVLRDLWRHLGKHTLVEFKGPSRGFRKGDLVRLHSYASEYLSTRIDQFAAPSELTIVLVVSRMTPTLTGEITWLGLTIKPLKNGYAQLVGGRYTTFVVCLDKIAERERHLLPFTHVKRLERDVALHALAWLIEVTNMEDIHRLEEDLDNMLSKLAETLGPQVLRQFEPEQRLAGLQPEQRLAGLEPEQRLAGLEPEQRLAGLDREQLARLQDAIRSKLADSGETA